MDDGEVDFSDRHAFSDCNDPSMESFLDELLKNAHSCTHTHTCNPPGPDKTHTHTCFHTHTHLFAPLEGKGNPDQSQGVTSERAVSLDSPGEPLSKKQTLGNREAVRKYREKKKAQTALLEEQVRELRNTNQQLLRKLQGQAALEAEVLRLRGLLTAFRGRIDGELVSGRSTQRLELEPGDVVLSEKEGTIQPVASGYNLNSCNLPCDADVRCLHSAPDSEHGPSTPQEYSSHTGVFGSSCEVVTGACQRQRRQKSRRSNIS